MRRLLLTLLVAGAAVYTVNFLVTTQDAVAVQTPPTQPVVRHLRSWGSYLSDLPLSQKSQTPLANYQEPAPLPLQQAAAAGDQPAASAGIDGSEHEPVEWTKVVFAAKVHREASVSSATVRYYRPGTELQIVRREDGWVGVLDPVT